MQGQCLAALDPEEMQRRLLAGAPILGSFRDSDSNLTRWMADIPDNTPIEAINIPGTHDACAWNYTGPNPETYNTQSLPIFDQLNAGIRFLDIRFGVNDSKIMVYHGDALLSDTVQLEDVLWGLYHFLDAHPTETIIASMKVDHGDATDSGMQRTLHDHFTTADTKDYWVQSQSLGTLGSARHKVILFRRYALLPDLSPIGIDVSHDWRDNDGDFVITASPSMQVWIEDLYELTGDGVPASTKVSTKFDAITRHLGYANASANKTMLFVTFASGYGSGVGDSLTPRLLAVGDQATGLLGINKMMVSWLQQRRDNRFGVILFDFFDSEPGVVAAAIGSSATPATTRPSSSTGAPSNTPTSSAATSLPVISLPFFILHLLVSFFRL